MDAATQRALTLLAGGCLLFASVAAYATSTVAGLSRELQDLRQMTTNTTCHVDESVIDSLKKSLGLGEVETLLRLASKEPAFGYGGGGGYGGYDSYGGGRGGAGGGRAGDYGGYGGAGGLYGGGGAFGPYGDDFGSFGQPADAGKEQTTAEKEAAAHARELQNLPTTQSLSCRSPRCERNASICAAGVARSLTTPYGCCNDYMLMMLEDVTQWLDQNQIPYFVMYGTLLGAVREEDILPWTQDMDIVVDRAHWPRLQRGVEGAEFFGGRRYFFGVDQWEERVSRVCADWEGFAASTIGGPDGDRFSRGTEFHLDVYASDWWQVKDMHLVDCVEPLTSAAPLLIRGKNFSAPARPRACVEKLYGAEWRAPKKALSGVN